MANDVLNMTARDLPFPKAISPEAREILRQAYANRMPRNMPALDDHQGWLAAIAAVEAPMLPVADAFLAAPGATVVEKSLKDTKVYVITPDVVRPGRPKVRYFIHGGAWVLLGGKLAASAGKETAVDSGEIVHAIDYRMPPKHPFPAALDDCLAGYRELIAQYDPSEVLVAGVSAGGNIAAALMLRLKAEGIPLPAALFLDTPATDLTLQSDSLHTNHDLDSVVCIDDLSNTGPLYANGVDLANPLISPIYGDLSGFPPTYLRTGTRDLLLSDTVRMHAKLRHAGVDADLYVIEGAPHGGFDPIGASTTDDRAARNDLARWLEKRF